MRISYSSCVFASEYLSRVSDADMQMFFEGAHVLPPWLKLSSWRPISYMVRRSTLERICQKLLLASSPNVRILDGTIRQVEMSKGQSKHVESVQIRHNGGQSSTIQQPALLIGQRSIFFPTECRTDRIIVDCSGVTQAGLKWLKSAGCEIPQNKIVEYGPDLHYMTVTFFPPPEVAKRLPIPGGYDNCSFLLSYASAPSDESKIGFIFNRYENNIGE